MLLVPFGLLTVLALVTWTVPRQLFLLTPSRWRERLYGRESTWTPALVAAAAPFALGFPLGYAIDDPQLSRLQLGLGMGCLASVLAGGGLLFSWRGARQEQSRADVTAGPVLPRDATPPWQLSLPTCPPSGLGTVDHSAHRLDRVLRRTSTGLLALLPVLGIAVRVADDGSPLASWLLVLGLLALVAVLAIPWLLRHRAGRGHEPRPHMLGGSITRNDSDRVARRFPNAPLLRPHGRFERVEHPRVIDGVSNGRYWWVVEQRAALNGDYQPVTRTTCLTWLPGVDLPPLLVRGRDQVELTRWFSSGMVLESWDFGQRLHVLTDRAHQRESTAVLHPRMMQHLLEHLPDGVSLHLRGDVLSLVLDRALSPAEVAPTVAVLLRCADLLPTFLLKELAARP